MTVRPEIRYERSYRVDAYDNPSGNVGGGKKHQLMLASDLIFHF